MTLIEKVAEVTILKLEDKVVVIENGEEPEVHKIDFHNCMNCFSTGTYRVHVFNEPKLALGYQKLNYKKKPGYRILKKYLTKHKLI